jgi:2-polyprenyl-3-methyl-5-hydroxy-6-metoxy-1,4-benzoquinol methylase
MMFGLREPFTYFQCCHCSCLQIAEFPAGMERYYPDDYYIMNDSAGDQEGIPEWLHTMVGGPLISAMHPLHPGDEQRLIKKAILYYFQSVRLSRHSRILDVGCGRGSFLRALSKIGFTNLYGVDLYIKASITYDDGVTVCKGTIADLNPDSRWDVIMFHHSLEHMADQLSVLQTARQHLAPGGCCLIRIPTVSSHAWERYGANWVALDAPRHFFLHSRQSLAHLARKARLCVDKILCDSTSFQFWGSEQYERDIPLYSEHSFAISPLHSIFTPAEIADFERQALQLNTQKRGDQAAFYLIADEHTTNEVEGT